MGTLAARDIDDVRHTICKEMSRTHRQAGLDADAIQLDKPTFRALIVNYDAQLDAGAENTGASRLPAGPGKDWVVAQSHVDRLIRARVADKRRDMGV